jgi:hypothetical protein
VRQAATSKYVAAIAANSNQKQAGSGGSVMVRLPGGSGQLAVLLPQMSRFQEAS